MKHRNALGGLMVLGLLLVGLGSVDRDVRIRPIRDAVGFCWQADQADRLAAFLQACETAPLPALPKVPFLGGIVPHDDHLYAGKVSFDLLSRVEAADVMIIGVTHSGVRKALGDPQGRIILEGYDGWQGPYGPVTISPLRAELKKQLRADSWMESDEAHRLEHAIEGLIPLLQHRQRQLQITPVMITAMPAERMKDLTSELAGVVQAYLTRTGRRPGYDFCVLISADGNHYGPDFDNLDFGSGREGHAKALAYDHQLLDDLTQGALTPVKVTRLRQALWGEQYTGRGRVLWCGKYSIPFGLSLLLDLYGPDRCLQPLLLSYSDTFTQGTLPFRGSDLGITAPFSLEHWVSFFSVAVY